MFGRVPDLYSMLPNLRSKYTFIIYCYNHLYIKNWLKMIYIDKITLFYLYRKYSKDHYHFFAPITYFLKFNLFMKDADC